ncbi:MAG: alanine racemase [Nanoarchaeota archaeon]|nr:alanine racemase [Nanoarchaeota archaeon]
MGNRAPLHKMIPKNIAKRILDISGGKKFKMNPSFYLYNLSAIKKQLDKLERYLPKKFLVYYAMKANPHKRIIKFLKEHKRCNGIEVSSIGELNAALKFFKADNVCFTGPGKTEYELKVSVDKGIKLINLESLAEAYRINSIAKRKKEKVDVLIRVNSNYNIKNASTNMAGISTKFGIDEDNLMASLNIIQKECPYVNIRGFHVFGASGVMDTNELAQYTNYVLNMISNLENKMKIKTGIIDLGGGFGIDYSGGNRSFDIKGYCQKLKKIIECMGFEDKTFILELGRYIVGDSGFYCSEINDIKESKGKKYIIACGGVNHLNRPNVTGENQPVFILKREQKFPNTLTVSEDFVDICGPLCFAEDKIGKDIYVKSAKIGDILVVTKAGAYGLTGSPLDFMSHQHPSEYFELFA